MIAVGGVAPEEGVSGEGGGDDDGEPLAAFGETVLAAGHKIGLGGIVAVDDLEGEIEAAEAADVEGAGGVAPSETGNGAVAFEGKEGGVGLGSEGGDENGAGAEFGAFVEEPDGGLDGAGGRGGPDLLLQGGVARGGGLFSIEEIGDDGGDAAGGEAVGEEPDVASESGFVMDEHDAEAGRGVGEGEVGDVVGAELAEPDEAAFPFGGGFVLGGEKAGGEENEGEEEEQRPHGGDQSLRKLARSCLPSRVRIDSGWNWTPWMGNSVWRRPMISCSRVEALMARTGGTVSRFTMREW